MGVGGVERQRLVRRVVVGRVVVRQFLVAARMVGRVVVRQLVVRQFLVRQLVVVRRRPTVTGTARVWTLNAALAAAGVLAYVLGVRHLGVPDAPVHLPWW